MAAAARAFGEEDVEITPNGVFLSEKGEPEGMFNPLPMT